MDALYFPFFELPETGSLNQVLLYWDSVTTMVPEHRVAGLSPRMRDLVDCELVSTIDPSPYVTAVDEFTTYFLDRVSATPSATFDADYEVWIDRDKATGRLWDGLAALGLARSAPDEGGRLAMPSGLGFGYMSYLAVLIARMRDVPTQPLTNVSEYWNPLANHFATGPDADRVRALILRNLLPGPADLLPARQIAAFKAQHWDELSSFRACIEDEVEWCSAQPTAELRVLSARRSNDQLVQRRDELVARMRESKWRTVATAVGAAILAAPLIVQASATGDHFAAATAASIPIAEGVKRVIEGTGRRWEVHSPLAYAAFAANEHDSRWSLPAQGMPVLEL